MSVLHEISIGIILEEKHFVSRHKITKQELLRNSGYKDGSRGCLGSLNLVDKEKEACDKITTSVVTNSVFKGFFEKQRLPGPNFIDWYRHLRILLSVMDKLDYLEQPIPPASVPAQAGQQVAPEALAAHAAWVKISKEIVGIMLMTTEPEIQLYLENLSAYEIMHDMGKTVNELHAMRKLHEKTQPKQTAPALHVIRARKVQKKKNKQKPHFRARGKNQRKGKYKRAYHPKPKISPPMKKKNPAKDSICHQCGETGHWKRNCPQNLAELLKNMNLSQGASSSGIFTIELNTFLNRSWIYDTGCGTHICNTTQGLRVSRKLKPGALSLYVGNGQRKAVEAISVFHLCLPSGLEIVLNNCHYALFITRGVIFVSRLYEDGFINRVVNNTIQVSRNNMVYFSAIPKDGIFEIDLSNSYANDSSIYIVSNKRAKLDLDSALLWHCRLGHISKKRIEKLQHDGLLNSNDLRAFEKCVSCMSGKMARKPYTHQVERAKDLLGLIHTDVCGPFKIMSRQGASYFVTFTDDFSRYGYVYLLKHKHEVFETFKVFQREDHGIIVHRTPPYTPQHNGVSERRNRTLPDMVRSMMSQTTLPKSFGITLLRLLQAFSIWFQLRRLKRHHTKYGMDKPLSCQVWGCEALVKRDTLTKPDKLEPSSYKYLYNRLLTTWESFTRDLETRFGPSSYDNHQAALFKLRQTTTVSAYQTEFERLSNCVIGLPPEALLNCFISGLRLDIQQELAILRPYTITQAIGLAKLIEDKTNEQKFRPRYTNQNQNRTTPLSLTPTPILSSTPSASTTTKPPLITTPPKQPQTLPYNRLSADALQQRRAARLCFRCPKRYHPGHKCNPPQFLIIVDNDDTLETPTPILPKNEGTTSNHLMFADNDPNKTITAPQYLSLSPAAFLGLASPKALRITAYIMGHPVTVLVDSGSTHNIIQPHIASFLNLSITPIPSFPVMVVRKKDGTWRFCVDYRALNAITIRDRFPIPTVDELLDELHGAQIFSKIDLRAGYHQIRLADADTHKTAFRTVDGHFEFLVMPFGLSNAPSTFQAAMNDIFRDVLRKFVLVFFDDILIYSPSRAQHYQHLRHVFDTLAQHRYYAKRSKCTFGVTEVHYLGHVISQSGVATDCEKIKAIQDWPKPSTVTGLRGFLGLTGYYRRFVSNYAHIASPLTDLLQKSKFEWNDEAQEAFDILKKAMSTLPVLALPDFSLIFDVTTDASGTGIGAVLSQKDKPIAFFSKKLSPRMRSSSTYIRELYAITEAVKKWRHYLLGRKFRVFTDQRSLKHLLTQVVQSPEQYKWASKLLGYDFEVHYKPGKENRVADALSRIEESQLLSLSTPIFPWLQELREYYTNNPEGRDFVSRVAQQVDALPVITFTRRLKLLNEFHSTTIGGHSGITATIKRISGSFSWPRLRKDVTRFIQECTICQQTKYSRQKPYGLLQALPIPNQVWEEISMDFITNLPTSNGKSAIWVIVDRLTKFAHFLALPPHYTAASLANLFLNHIYRLHGLPKSILSDRDPIFLSRFWKELFGKIGTKLLHSSAYHPQTDGQTEVVNRCLESYLRCFACDEPHSWNKYLYLAEFWYNTSYHSAIEMTPFQALYGRPPPSLPRYTLGSSQVASIDATLMEHERVISLLKDTLTKTRQRMTDQANKHRVDKDFEVGELVYLRLRVYRQTSVARRDIHKLSRHFFGPFKVLETIGKVSLSTRPSAGSRVHPIFHVSLLRPSQGDPNPSTLPLPNKFIDDIPVLEPEEILDRRTVHNHGITAPQLLVA
ncbi:ty3-gypsy retrotransposon protein [Tanacetum coccineum]